MSSKAISSLSKTHNGKASPATPSSLSKTHNGKASPATPSSLSKTHNGKASPATLGVKKVIKGVTKPTSVDSSSSLQSSRLLFDCSPKSVNSKPSLDCSSPKLPRTPPATDKPQQSQLVSKGSSDLLAQLTLIKKDLKKLKDQLNQVETEKSQTLEELKESQKSAKEANLKLREALVAQKLSEQYLEIEKLRAAELEQARIEATNTKDQTWHTELQRLQQELDVKTQTLIHAENATKLVETIKKESREKLVEKDSLIDQLNLDLEAAKLASQSEIITLKERISLLETSLQGYKSDKEESDHRYNSVTKEALEMASKFENLQNELEMVKEEKEKLINELNRVREEEEKSRQGMEGLAAALHEVSSEARETKENLMSLQSEYRFSETQVEDLKLVLKGTNEKYESMLDKIKMENEDSIESLEKEKRKFEITLKEVEEVVLCLKKKESKLEAECLKFKQSLVDKEAELQTVIDENIHLRAKKDGNLEGEFEEEYDMIPKVGEFYEQNGDFSGEGEGEEEVDGKGEQSQKRKKGLVGKIGYLLKKKGNGAKK